MFAGFCGHADKSHIYTALAVTIGPLRANITLIWPLVKMCLTTCYSVAEWAKVEISVVSDEQWSDVPPSCWFYSQIYIS